MESQENDGLGLLEIEIPDKCPECGLPCKNLLIHIRKSNCISTVSQDFYNNLRWTIDCRRTRKVRENVARWRKLNPEKSTIQWKKSYEKFRDLRWNRKGELYEIENQKRAVKYKTVLFFKLARKFLSYFLSPPKTFTRWSTKPFFMNKNNKMKEHYDLFRTDHTKIRLYKDTYDKTSVLNEKDSHAWVKKIDVVFLEAVITFQIVIFIEKFTWEKAIKRSRKNKELEEKLLILVGKLQAHSNWNTRDILIPQKFKAICKQSGKQMENIDKIYCDYYKEYRNTKLSQKDQKQLINFIHEILGGDLTMMDEDLQKILMIKEKMENLYVALGFASIKM